jgi:adenine-specific DNA-methyltransferase
MPAMRRPRTDLLQTDLGGSLGLMSERDLIALAISLGAEDIAGISAEEKALLARLRPAPKSIVARAHAEVADGFDPLGESFCAVRGPVERRRDGAIYTPLPLVRQMLDSVAEAGEPSRVIDPGTGSARFLVEAGRRFPSAKLIGVELDPVAALLARAHLASAGLANRAEVMVTDFRSAELPVIAGSTAYVGNPPYVRHHLIERSWKEWLVKQARIRGCAASQLAGLHAYFFLATAIASRAGDTGSYITAAEWLDVNYGNLVRELLVGVLGAKRIRVIEPKATPFPDTMVTAVITEFEVASRPPAIELQRVTSVGGRWISTEPRLINRERLESEKRWSHLTRPRRRGAEGYIELGEICRVHRGQVTGANRFWLEGPHSVGVPDSVLYRTVTRARELFGAGEVLGNPATLRRIIDLPEDLSVFSGPELDAVERLLAKGRQLGVHLGYVASHRRAWWAVGLREPAPILATYMARRPPAFVRNLALARHINIAHGLYPRVSFDDSVLSALVRYLSSATQLTDGRTYAGGLTKFEPREMERILVPSPELLQRAA